MGVDQDSIVLTETVMLREDQAERADDCPRLPVWSPTADPSDSEEFTPFGPTGESAAYLVVGAAVLAALYGLSRSNYLLFHALVELFSISVAGSIFLITINSRRVIENGYLLFIGVGWLFVAGTDLVHTLAYKGMGAFAGDGADLPTQLWIGARYLQSISLVIAAFLVKRSVSVTVVFTGFATATAALFGSIFLGVFPACYVEGVGLTQFKIISEFFICGLLAAGLVLLIRVRRLFEETVFQLLAWSIALMIVSEIAFTLYTSVTGFWNFCGHILKVVAFFLVYKAIVETGLKKPFSLLLTDVRKEQEALRRSEKRFRKVFTDQGAIGMALTDEDGRWVEANPRLRDMVGYSADELEDLRSADLIHPDDAAADEADLRRLFAGEISNYSREVRFVRKDGSILWVNLTVSPMRDLETASPHALLTAENITERKVTAERLQWEMTMQSALAGLYEPLVARDSSIADVAAIVLEQAKSLTDSEHGYVSEIDPDTRDMTSHTLTFMMGESCRVAEKEGAVFPCGADGLYAKLWGHSLNTRQGFFTNAPRSHPSTGGIPEGHIPIRRFLSAPVTLGAQLVGQIALANPGRDYTERDLHAIERLAEFYALAIQRKRSEEALRKSEENFRQLAENIEEVFWSTLPGDPRRIAYLSPVFESVWGISREEVYTNPLRWRESVHPEDRDRVVALYTDFVENPGEYNIEYRLERPDGSVRWVWDRAFAIYDDDGGIYRIAGLAQDITQRVADQEKQAQLMEEIRHFAYIVSHDLRAPLTNLGGFCEELDYAMELLRPVVEDALPSLPEERRREVEIALREDFPEAVTFIKSSTGRMHGLIDAILKLSRLGRSELTIERIDMNALIRETLGMMAHQINQGGVTVHVDDLPDAHADRIAMEQITANLISNAIQYLDSDRPGRLEITGAGFSDETVIRVADNGIGIPEEHIGRIFEIFHRVGQTDAPGEGMGLSYVRTLVRRHGGRIWCESQPGVGSTFTFTIPRMREASNEERDA